MTFKELFQEHKNKIYRLCKVMVYDKNLIDDLFQEVSLNIWKGYKNFKGDSKLDTWLYRIIINTSITFNDRNNKYQNKKDNYLNDSPRSTEQTSYQNNIIMSLVNSLRSGDRAIIGLYLEGYTYKEMSQILELTTTNIGVKITRIKEKLKSIANNKNI